MHDLLVITGPTASGKTKLAVSLARELRGEIISGDSRQVYRGMDIGTGKDPDDYGMGTRAVPYHLIDIRDAGEKYLLFDFQRDFIQAFQKIVSKPAYPILCGGSGLYLSSVLDKLPYVGIPVDEELRKELQNLSDKELQKRAQNTLFPKDFNPDLSTTKRTKRALEIAHYCSTKNFKRLEFPEINYNLVVIDLPAEVRRQRITTRLQRRFEEGMTQEVEQLISAGISIESLEYYGLEYKIICQHLTGVYSYEQCFKKLEVAIHQFAKRQMTWFRKMEREGKEILWVDGTHSLLDQQAEILQHIGHQ